MSQTIDNRIVEMQFENKQFESGVQESLSTLDKLKNALKFDDASKNLQDFSKNINKNVDLSGLSRSVDEVSSKFSASGIAGMEVIRRLTDFAIDAGKAMVKALDAPFAQIRSGGWKRAMNIEDAKFQLKGLGIAWETVADDINYAVADTAYGLDVAAKACSQLSASSVQAGDDMKAALRGISGVAAMGNTEYENIAQIFTKAAGNGKVMADELNRISQYGLNARASLSTFFNAIVDGDESVADIPENVKKRVMSITKGMHVAEADISEFARKSKIDFQTFSYAMDNAFGEHAKKANETFMGSLRNIKAALSKIGAEFATPIIQGAIPIFNEIRVFLNDLRKHMTPIFTVFSNIANIVSGKLTNALYKFRVSLLEFGAIDKIGNAIKNVFTSIVKIIVAVRDAFRTVFPPANNFARIIDSIADGIESFSEHLVISDEAMLAFRNVMVVVFNILKAVAGVIKGILPLIGKAATVVMKVISVVAGLVAYLINLVSNLKIVKTTMSAIEKAGGLFAYAIQKIKEAFAKLRDIMSDTTTVTGRFFSKLKDVAATGAYIVGGALYLAFVKLRDLFSYFDTHDPLGSIMESLNKLKNLPVINSIITGIETAFGVVIVTIQKVIDMVVTFVNEIKNGATIFEAFGTVAESAIGAVLTAFTKLKDTVKGWFSVFTDNEKVIEETVESPIYGANVALAGFAKEISLTKDEVNKSASSFDNAKTAVTSFGAVILDKIRNINASKVILAAYAGVLLLVAYNSNRLLVALTKLTIKLSGGFLNLFRIVPTKFDKFKAGLAAITASIVALAGAIYMLKDVPVEQLDKITSSLLKLIGLVGGLSLAATIIVEVMTRFGGTNAYSTFSANMFMLAAGIATMVMSLKLLENVNMDNIWTKVGVLLAIGGGLTAFSILAAKLAPQLTLGSLFMVAFAGACYILVEALDKLSHVNLKGINENWKELGVIIVSFAAFAALAGSVGITSTLSLIAFIVGLSTLLRNVDRIKDQLKQLGIADMLAQFFENLKNGVKNALLFALETYLNLSELEKTLLGITALLTGAGIAGMLFGLGYAAKNIKKAALSAVVFAAAMAGLMFAVYKIAESCKSISSADVGKAIAMLGIVGALLATIIGVTGYFAGDTESGGTEVFGKGAKKITTTGKKVSNKSNSIKQARKMLLDMGILLASVALFCNVVGKLTPTELEQAEKLLLKVGVVFGALMIVIALISSHSRTAASSAASIVPFMGIIAVIGTLLGSFVILMNYFKDFNIETEWPKLLVVLGIMTLMVVGVIEFLKTVSKLKQSGSSWASILAFSAVIVAIGGVVYHLTQTIKSQDDLKRAGIIAGGIAGFLTILVTLVLVLEGVTTKILTTTKRQSAFTKAIAALGVMVAAIGVLALTFYGLRNIDTGRMALQAAVLIGVLGLLSTLVMAIQHFSKDSLTSITKTSGPKLKQTIAMIGMFFAAFELLAITFAAMRNVNPDNMASQMLTLIIALTALTALGLAIQHFVKTMQTDWGTIAKSGAILGGMVALFTALALVFKYIVSSIPDQSGLNEKVELIILTLLKLEVLCAAAGVLGMFAKEVALGELTLAGMVGLFMWMTYIFKTIDKLNVSGLDSKCDTIKSTMWSLIGMMTVLGLLGAIMVGTGGVAALMAAAGLAAMAGMIALFGWMAKIFTIINGINVSGLDSKCDAIKSTMWSLIGMMTVLGLASPLAALAILGIPGILAVTYALKQVAEGLSQLGDIPVAQTQGTLDALISALWSLMGIGAVGIVSGEGLLVVAAGITALGSACGVVAANMMAFSNAVEALSVSILKLTSTGSSIMAWFSAISIGVATLASTIMNSITGLSKSVVIAVNTLIIGIITAITAGGTMIFAAAVGLGNKMKQGFDSIIKPKLWGADLVKTFASGIMSNLGPIINAVTAVAKIIRSYLHFTNPDVGPLSDAASYMPDMMSLFGNGITSNMGLVLGPVGILADSIKDKLTGIDLSSAGQFLSQSFANGISSGSGGIFAQLNSILQAIGLVKGEIATMTSSWAKGQGTLADREYQLKTAIGKTTRELDKQTAAYERLSKNGTRSGETAKKKAEETKKVLEEQTQQLNELYGASKKADEAVEDLTKGFGGLEDAGKGAKGSTKEITDEIANFYDSMEGAINLFEEFNKQTELTSDKLLENMRSQISGMSEWADQIQKLAFMGIDQGLLQELADMGPQGYEYTNAFVHMTAEQLAEANNLYHQSLMLPAKVTSQIYGSYTVAGRSAASGFLMGMNQADLKEAAVGFAHQVVDQMNLALDIQSGAAKITYEDGVAVVNGVKTGMQASDVQAALARATELLTKEKITDKFRDGLFTHNTIYNMGANITKGLADGVKDEGAVGDLVGAVTWVGNKAKTTIQDVLKEKSPSRVFMKIGNFITLGLAKGITDETQAAVSAMDKTANTIIDSMRETINKANDSLIEDIDEPVITPILDLSEIQNGSRELNSMLSHNSAFSAGRSFSNLQNEQWNSQNALLNATMDNSDVVSAIDTLNEEVATLKDVMTNLQIVLDTGIMVGAMTPAIDQQLGMRQVLAGRGI